jgi:hypothetical protein
MTIGGVAVKKFGTISISLLLILTAVQFLLVPTVLAQEHKDAALYLWGDGHEDGELRTEYPFLPTFRYQDAGPGTGTFIIWVLGDFITAPFKKDTMVTGTFMANIWVEQTALTPGRVMLDCEFTIDGVETGLIFESEQIIITDYHEISFGGHIDIPVTAGQVLGVHIQIHYTGISMNVLWESDLYPSHLVVPADWCSNDVLEPVVDDDAETTQINAIALHALGPDEIIDFELEIDGPSTASTITGPETSVMGDMVWVSWIWHWGNDGADDGTYDVIVTAIDNSNNTWPNTASFVITANQPPPPPPPPPQYNWTTLGEVTSHSSREYFPSLLQDSEGMYWLAYAIDKGNWNYDINLRKSEDGINWDSPIEVTKNNTWETYPSLMQDSKGVYWIAFTSRWGSDDQIWITNSSDGTSWREPNQAIKFRYDNIYPSMIEDSEGTYWIAWSHYNRSTYDWDICIISSQDGLDWDDSFTYVTYDADDDDFPSLIQDSSGTYRIAWSSDRNGYDNIFVTKSNDPKSSWGSPVELTSENRYEQDPSLIENVDGGFNITWHSSLYGDSEIYYMGSDNWNSWTSKEQVTQEEYPKSRKFFPSLIQDAQETLWIAWTSYASGNEDIWVSNKTTNEPPMISLEDLVGEQSGDIQIKYTIKDTGDDKCEIIPFYSLDGFTFYEAAQGQGGDGVSDISSSLGGTEHTFVWASDLNLSGVDIPSVYFRIIPRDSTIGSPDTTSAFQVDNNGPPEVEIDDVTGVQNGAITLSYVLIDSENDTLSIKPEYSIDGTEYQEATMDDDSPSITKLDSSVEGESYTLIWDSLEDLADQDESSVHFRITPMDDEDGVADTTSPFSVDNKAPTIISGPMVVTKTHTTATISWETDEPSQSELNYGIDSFYGNVLEGDSYSITHTMELGSLEPETEYHYFVGVTDELGNGPAETDDLTFTTEQIPNDPPVVSITSLKDNATVDGKITILGEASDPDGDSTIEFIEVRVDDNNWELAEGKTVWSYVLDTEDYDDGEHTLYVRAFDGREYSEEYSLTIKVDNEGDALSIWLIMTIIALIVAIVLIAVALKTRSPRPKPMPSQDFFVTAQPAPDFVPVVESAPAYEMIVPSVPAEPVEAVEYTPWNEL